MNEAVEFIEKAIRLPKEVLGVNQFASLDLSVEFLCRTKSKANKHLLFLTIDGLYAHLTDEMLERYKSNNPIFSCINKLLNSPWKKETATRVIELYFANYERNLIGTFLEALISGIEDESKFLVNERLFDCFGRNTDGLDDIEKTIYCIHVLNVSFAYHKGEYSFNSSFFSKCVNDNIIKLAQANNLKVNYVAIWALYWMSGGSIKEAKPLIRIDLRLKEYVCSLLAVKHDIKTKLRLSAILLKSSSKLLNKIDKSLTGQWAANISNKKIKKYPSGIRSFKYSKIIENNFLEALILGDKFWVYEIAIPYLGLMASRKAIATISENLKLSGQIKINSAIVLSGLGLLTQSKMKSLNIGKSEMLDEIVRFNTEFCYQVMGKDSSKRTAWYFVLIDKQKKDEFLAHKKGDNYDLADYGSVIESGYGKSVPEDVKEMLKEKYGFDNF